MKPEKEGFWFYKNEPVMVGVEISSDGSALFFETFPSIGNDDRYISDTEDSDWGPEILPPCEHEIKMCIHPTLEDAEICRGKLCTKKEITRPSPDESANDGNDAVG